MKPFEREWRWDGKFSDPELVGRLMAQRRTLHFLGWIYDQLRAAELELLNMSEHYERQIQVLEARVKELEARFIEDSHNSSKPPSSDGLRKKPLDPVPRTRSLREKSSRSPGAQPGHAPHFLKPEPDPDRVVVSPVHKCGRCGKKLTQAELLQHETRQVIDLHQGKRFVVEFRAEMKLCPNCQFMNHGGFPPEASAYVCYGPEVKRVVTYFAVYQLIPPRRVREILRDLFDLTLSEGSVHRFLIQASQSLKPWENRLKKKLIHASLAHFDETGMRCEGRGQWLHVSASGKHTLYVLHEKRGRKAMDSIGVLPEFKGLAVHDEWSPYWKYQQEGIRHAVCNAHRLRELTFVCELENEPWAFAMKALLQEAVHRVNEARETGKRPSPRWIRSVEVRFDTILRKGYRSYREKMPRQPSPPRAGPQEKKDAGHNLVRRLHYYRQETLAFLHDPGVPFTNNLAERDLRMAKLKQKISGCFRSRGGAKAFCRIRSLISTCRKQGLDAYRALRLVFRPVDYSLIPVTEA